MGMDMVMVSPGGGFANQFINSARKHSEEESSNSSMESRSDLSSDEND